MNHVVMVTIHAWKQYCQRVEQISYEDLRAKLSKHQIHPQRKNDLIQLDEVWWVVVDPNIYVTCYGRSHLDMPKAIAWASMHNDRIPLDG